MDTIDTYKSRAKKIVPYGFGSTRRLSSITKHTKAMDTGNPHMAFPHSKMGQRFKRDRKARTRSRKRDRLTKLFPSLTAPLE